MSDSLPPLPAPVALEAPPPGGATSPPSPVAPEVVRVPHSAILGGRLVVWSGRVGVLGGVEFDAAVIERLRDRDRPLELPQGFPDDPEALQAVGRCGGKNGRNARHLYCHRWQEPRIALPPEEARRVKRRARCHRHGGGGQVGPANAAWGQPHGGRKTALRRAEEAGAVARVVSPGKYSGILGGTYADFYRLARDSGEVARLDEQIALCDAREGQLVVLLEARRQERGEADEPWRRVRDLVGLIRRAGSSGDQAAYARHFDELAEVARVGAGEAEVWKSLHENMLVRRHLVDTERKVLSALGAYMSKQEAMLLASRIIDVLRVEVTDRGDLARASAGISRLFAGERRASVKVIDGSDVELQKGGA